MMRPFIFLLALAGLLFAPSWSWCEEDCGSEAEISGDPAVIKQLRVEINALNLMNGLHLTAGQVEALLEGAKKNRDLRIELLGEGKAEEEAGSREQYEALKELKEKLEKGEDAGPEFLKKLKSYAEKARRKKKAVFKADRKRYHRELRALERKIEGILLDSQRDVISTYKPCLIPPRNLKDPVRVGQASNHGRTGKLLERLRKLSKSRWGKLGRAMMEKYLEAWEERHGRFPEGEREAEIERSMKVVEETRALSEVDFQMRKDDLARRFAFTDRKEELQHEIKEIAKKKADLPGMIAHTLLDARIIPVLERRLRQLNGFEPGTPVDLAGIKGTDAKKGKCGCRYED